VLSVCCMVPLAVCMCVCVCFIAMLCVIPVHVSGILACSLNSCVKPMMLQILAEEIQIHV